jgi:pimeloyl-ACP methyl ester carboxylesterase
MGGDAINQETAMTAVTMTAPAARHRLPLKRFAAIAALGLLALGAMTLTVPKAMLAAQHGPPGQLVDIGGYRLHLNCTGSGAGPTVILEAGNADFSVHWAAVQPEVARVARVCSYDRAGLGWSDRGPRERTTAAMVDELGLLLDAAAIDGPLILAGHSAGAAMMRAVAAAHPDRIAGLVLVDPAHEAQADRIPALRDAAIAGATQFAGLQPLATWGILALSPGMIPNRGLPQDAYADYASLLATTGNFATAAEETERLGDNLAAVGGLVLPDVPVTIVSRGGSEPLPGMSETEVASFEAQWQVLQADLAEHLGAKRVAAEGSGHYVQLEQSALVVAAIAEQVEAARGE